MRIYGYQCPSMSVSADSCADSLQRIGGRRSQKEPIGALKEPTFPRLVTERLFTVRIGRFLRGTKLDANEVLRSAIFSGGPFQKLLRRCVVFQIGIQKVQSIERNPGITRVGVLPSVVGHLILCKALRTLPALEHGTELRMCHAQHIHVEKITMDPGVEDIWTIFVCGRNVIIFQIFKTHISSKAKKRYGHSLWMDVPGSFHEAGG